jgi:hypothetical protein
MDDKLTIFIGVTAAAVVLQMLILAGMFFTVRKLSKRVQSLTDDMESKLKPMLADMQAFVQTARPKLEHIIDNASSISTTAKTQAGDLDVTVKAFMGRARLQAIRVDQMVTRTLDNVENATTKVQNTVVSPLRHLNGVLQGIGVGLEAFFDKQKRSRNGQNDEMFI